MRRAVATSLVLAAGLAALAAGCGGSSSVAAVPKSSCGPVEYRGSGKPNALIVSDLPLRAPPGGREQVSGIEYVLALDGYKAGKYRIGYQSCDDSSVAKGAYDEAVCTANAKAYAADKDVLAVIGPYNSPCAAQEIPIADAAPGGPLAMLGSGTTDPELTAAVPGANPGAPGIFYPKHVRNFARLTAPDQFQPAAAAMLAKVHGLHRVFVLNDSEGYGQALAGWFESDAKRLGVGISGSAGWNPKAKSYSALMGRVKNARPDGVYLSGFAFLHGTTVLRALRARLGSRLVIIAPDGFADPNEVIKGAGKAADGLFVTLAGARDPDAGPLGKEILAQTGATKLEQYGALYGAAAVSTVLDAISRSNGTRPSVTTALFHAKTPAGIIGRFGFDAEGDPTTGAMSILHFVNGRLTFARTLYPTTRLAKGSAKAVAGPAAS
jgi:branched-chain amino acid transport system substrate-binding protein